MHVYFQKKCRIFAKLYSIASYVIVLLLGFAELTVAETAVKTPGDAVTDMKITADKGSELQLQVWQMPLALALKTIERETKVPIHYSVLPEGLVTATCVGTTLKQVLECLLARKADLIVRYSRSTDNGDDKVQVAEAWILGSKFDASLSNGADCAAVSAERANEGSVMLTQNKPQDEAEPDQTDELLRMAQSKNAAERGEAIGGLLSGGRQGDPDVKAALEQALNDEDANVRAQAISSLAHREGGAASGAIQEALHDSSVDVRMMAVDGITDDVALLQQAINDSDETVRSFATLKLEELTQINEGKP